MIDATNNIHIMHIAPGDLWAGAEVQLYNLVTSLDKLPGVSVSVVLLNHDTLEKKLIKSAIDVTVIEENELSPVELLRSIIHLIRDRRPDVIHTQRSKVNIFGCIAAYTSGRIPSLRTAHGSQELPPTWRQAGKRLTLFLEWLCDRFAQQRVIAVSPDLANILEKKIHTDKICVIENGIDSVLLINELNEAKRNTTDYTYTVGIAGRLVPIKRIDLFIRAAYQFRQQHPDLDVSFHIYGDGPLREELETLNIELKTDDIVHFEGHNEDMPQKLKALNTLFMTSDHEGLPMILLEAMALETPIIAHAVGGITNLLDQGECGVLVEEHTALGYSDALYDLINDSSKRNDITHKALERVTSIYSAENNARSHLALYEKISGKT